jgi:dihydroorotate dehydrogenase (fumarate)
MSDLSTRYLGLNLKGPLLASASPLCESVDNIKRLEDQGISGAVLPSLFEEQLELESLAVDSDLARGSESFPESANFFPDLQTYNLGPDGYLELIRHAKESVGIPIIASVNGISKGGWLQYGKMMEEAGADAIELNIYSIVTDPAVSGAEVEKNYIELVRQLKRSLRVPLTVKLSPFFSAPANMGVRFDEAHADGITSRDVIKCVLAGAKVAFMTSALLRNGVQHAAYVLKELSRWLDEHEYSSVQQMCGSMSHGSVPDPTAFERGNYMKVLSSYTLRANVFND